MKWAEAAKRDIGIEINYQSIGSGAGINQIRNRTVTFGATDAPLDDPGDLYQFPTVEGSVVPTYNLPSINDLKLTMGVINKIYTGSITFWNDPAISALNPDKTLPKLPIVPIYRADGSGTTFIWTSAMKKAGGWNDAGTTVKWPAGQGAKGNDGVAAAVQRFKGSIGYVELIYAKLNKLDTALLDVEVTGRTYVLLPYAPKDREAHRVAIEFFTWCFANGRDIASAMHYKPLSTAEYAKIIFELDKLR